MASVAGTNVSNNGLVFHLDLDNGAKSWKGKPTTNLVDYPYFNGVNPMQNVGNYGFGADNFLQVSPEAPAIGVGNSGMAVKNTTAHGVFNIATANVGVMNQGDQISLTWYVKGEGGTVGQYPWIWGYNNSADGAVSTGLTGLGPLTDEWQKFTYTYTWTKTTPSAVGFTSYIRCGFGTGDRFHLSNPQIERSPIPTKFVDGIRLDTASIIDISSSKSTVTVNNLTYRQDDNPTFDGTNDHIVMDPSVIPVGSSMTLDVWVKDIDLQATSIIEAENSAGGRTLNVHLPWSEGTIFFDCGGEEGQTSYDRVTYASSSADRTGWHNWTFTKDLASGTMRIYLDGVQKAQGTGAVKVPGVTTAANIGMAVGGGNYWDGELSQMRIYSRALTASEITRNYEANRARYGV